MSKTWKLIKEFVPYPLSSYDPYSIDTFVKHWSGFCFDVLFVFKITAAEKDGVRIEIDYEKDKFTAIRIFWDHDDMESHEKLCKTMPLDVT